MRAVRMTCSQIDLCGFGIMTLAWRTGKGNLVVSVCVDSQYCLPVPLCALMIPDGALGTCDM